MGGNRNLPHRRSSDQDASQDQNQVQRSINWGRLTYLFHSPLRPLGFATETGTQTDIQLPAPLKDNSSRLLANSLLAAVPSISLRAAISCRSCLSCTSREETQRIFPPAELDEGLGWSPNRERSELGSAQELDVGLILRFAQSLDHPGRIHSIPHS